MRLISDNQRRAMFAHLRMAQRQGQAIGRSAARRWAGLSPNQRIAAVGAATLGSAILSTRPTVTHVPRSAIAKEYGANMLAYTTAPLVGMAIEARRQGKPAMKVIKRRWKTAIGSSMIGLGAWFGERSLLHSMMAFVPESTIPQDVRDHAGSPLRRRAAYIYGHGLPLAATGAGLAYIGSQLIPARRQYITKKATRKFAVEGFAHRIGEGAAEFVASHIPGATPYVKPLLRAASIGSLPALSLHKLGRKLHRR